MCLGFFYHLYHFIWILFIVSTLDFLTTRTNCDCGGRDSGKEIVEILIWSGGSWCGFTTGEYFNTPNFLGHPIDKKKWNCPVDCRFLVDKTKIGNVDAVLFEAQPVSGFMDLYMRDVPNFPQKYPGQSWINFGYETHFYFHLNGNHGYMDYIDINMTYSLNSQVPITLTCLWGGGNVSDLLEPPPKKSKEKCVAMTITNCFAAGAAYRTTYIKELMQYIPVDSYGECLHNKDLPKEMSAHLYSDFGASMRSKIKLIRDYKFVLSFENNNVTDYVTEKMINVFQAGTVPVYMGAPNADPYWIPGEHSIVKTDGFKGPRELAQYLRRMCDDDVEYQRFFEWKRKGLSAHFQKRIDECVFYGAECRLCQYILEKRKALENQQDLELIGELRKQTHYYHALQLHRDKHQYLQLNHAEILTTLETQFSIVLWLKTLQPESPLLDSGFLRLSLKEIWHRSYLELCVGNRCFVSTRPLAMESWYHVGVVFRKSQVNFYINGKENSFSEFDFKLREYRADTKDSFSSEPSSEHPRILLIGATKDRNDSFFDGFLDDISIWSVAFDRKIMYDIVWKVFSGNEPNLIAYWSFNHAPNDLLNDSSPNKLHALWNSANNDLPDFVEMLSKPLVTANELL